MFHERLKELRENENISREHLAKSLDITYSALSKYETGKRQPDFETLQKIADYFSVTTDYLLGRTNDPKTHVFEFSKTTEKDEKDIAKRMKELTDDLANNNSDLAFNGEPISDEAKESLLEAMEFAVRTAKKINKKYTPKKYLNKEKD